MTRENRHDAPGRRTTRFSSGPVGRPTSLHVCLLCLALCGAILLPPTLASSGSHNNPKGVGTRPAASHATQREAEAADLPDLDEARRRPSHDPRALPPVPSKRRRCPPRNRRCNDETDGEARPRPTPPAPHRVGQAGSDEAKPASTTALASLAGESFLTLASAALNGGRPLVGLSLLDYYGGGGYSVTDAAPEPLLPAEPLPAAPTALSVIAASDAAVSLGWASSGAANYRVERGARGAGGISYGLAGLTSATGFDDHGVVRAASYLYRVCASDASGNCLSPFGGVVMATAYRFDDDPIVTYSDHQQGVNLGLPLTPIRAAHVTELREAINSVRRLAGVGDASWAVPNGSLQGAVVRASHVTELRSKLDEALQVLGVPTSAYTDDGLAGAQPNTVTIKRAHVTELRERSTRGLVADSGVTSGQGTGLTAQYYDNEDLTGFVTARTDPSVDFDWGGGSPSPQMDADTFSVRWAGMVVPRYTEPYTFHTTSDDGVRLWVDGMLVIDKWFDQAPTTEWMGQFPLDGGRLEAGRAYAIKVEFYEHGGGAMARLKWSSASQPKEVIPRSQLYLCWKETGQYVGDFFQGVLGRQPATAERRDWSNRLAQAQGDEQTADEAKGLGRALFASAEYAARNPDQHQEADARQYVADLYRGYLQREPEQSGWNYWTQNTLANGRAYTLDAFETSLEFRAKAARLCGTASASPENGGAGYNFSTARLDPNNRTGGGGADPYSRNYNFQIPLVSLPGRAGLDLGLTLSYNSLVWAKDASGVTFDADEGYPSAGFRLGFPVVEPRFVNAATGKQTYLLVTPSGARVELRQVGGSNVYESADSSYLQLVEGNGVLTLLTADGTQMTFYLAGGSYRCYQVKDRNGNFISAGYYGDGRIDRVVDTLGRTLLFVYDDYQNLSKITQPWRRETEANPNPTQDEEHKWATFGYADVTLQPQFANLAVIGDQPGAVLPLLNQVGLSDGSYYRFEYNAWGQVWKVTHYAADAVGANGQPNLTHALTSARLNLPGSNLLDASPQGDCPRFTEERVWVEKGVMNQDAEVTTPYSTWAPDMASCDVTAPDGTIFKEIYATAGWQRGLTTQSEVWSGGQRRKWTTVSWTQDDAGATYRVNPRVVETNIYDAEGNRRRTGVTYTSYGLPQDITEYGSDGSTVLRTTRTEYDLSAEYTSRRIIGLPSFRYVYEGTSSGTLVSKVGYVYDDSTLANYLQGLPSAASQQDATNYGTSFRWRGNVSRVRRYDVTGTASSYVESTAGYLVAGAVAYTKDASGHQTSFSYTDSFFQNVNRTSPDPQYQLKTYAYPTAVTDPDGFTSTSSYNYDAGLVTKVTDPKNAIVNTLYDNAGRAVRVTRRDGVNNVEKGYTRMIYAARMDVVQTYALLEAGVEAYSARVLDGAGRVRATARSLPGSAGQYAGQITDYDAVGRVARQSNPTETDTAGSTWVAKGDDDPDAPHNGPGWLYTRQSYDWKGRPVVVTNTDGATHEFLYGGCACAGGEVVTTRDEMGRRQKFTSNVLGRVWKTQLLNFQDKSQALSAGTDADVYSTTTTVFDALDRPTSVTVQEGVSGASQVTTMSYDGHGRLRTEHRPEQDAGTATVYSYYADDTVQTVTDARGATTSYGYDGRHLVTAVSYGGANLAATPGVTFDYDGAGNRLWMDDGPGRTDYTYDTLSRLQSETRQLDGAGSYNFTYTYNLADELETVNDLTFGTSFTTKYDSAGRVKDVNGAGYGTVSQFLKGAAYRAWGAAKSVTYGNDRQMTYAYDGLMRVSRATLAGVMDRSFEYYSDGRVSYAKDFLNNKHDRSYGYDLAGRRTTALSGFEARPGGVSSEGWGPYRQTYGYDVWGNMTGRTWRTWFTTPTGSTVPQSNSYGATYDARNRMTGSTTNGSSGGAWQYDAEGNLRQSTSGSAVYQYTYDQAGQLVSTAEPGRTTQQAFDGDGGRVKYVEGATVTYYVRSAALGGQILVEVGASGQKLRAYVYAGSSPLAAQEGTGSGVRWEHRDPTNVGIYWTYTAATVQAGEYDPLGVPAPEVPGLSFGYSPPYNSGSFGSPDMGCTVDRIPTPCDKARRWVSSGVAVPCPNNDCGPQHVEGEDEDGKPGGGWRFFNGSGYFYSNGSDSGYVGFDEVEYRDASDPRSWAMYAVQRKKERGRGVHKRKPKPGFELNRPLPQIGRPMPPSYYQATSDGQLPPCLRDALRPFFPAVNVNGKSYSPVDDARLSPGVPALYAYTADPWAITLGLDVHFDPDKVNINIRNNSDVRTVTEEVAHVEQFLNLWAGMRLGTSYTAARNTWKGYYIGAVIRARGSYDNFIERGAKKKRDDVLSKFNVVLCKP